jgi:CRP-like cAMP-binding protein
MPRQYLTRHPLFRLLAPEQLEAWIGTGQEFSCATGDTIFQENTPGAWIYLIQEGRIRILRDSGGRELTLGIMTTGDVFGEYALLPPGQNTATCRAATRSRLLRLPLEPARTAIQGMKPVWKNLKNWLRLQTLLQFRREKTFLGFMSAESGLRLLDRLQPVTFQAGQTIQARGLEMDSWYLIEEGKVRLQHDELEASGEELGPGDTFGEGALHGSGRLPTAVALTDVRCQSLARHDFDPSVPHRSLVAQSYEPRLPSKPIEHVWVPQLEPADCGLASLAMVGQRLGAGISVEKLRVQIAPGPEGLSLAQLRQLALHNGLPCRPVQISVDRLGQVTLPAIAHLRNGHYVVLHALGESVVIGDPETGIVKWSNDYLAKSFSGALLLFDVRKGAG